MIHVDELCGRLFTQRVRNTKGSDFYRVTASHVFHAPGQGLAYPDFAQTSRLATTLDVALTAAALGF